MRFLLGLAVSSALFAQTVTVSLNGTVSDDGLPSNNLTVSWSRISGPGAVAFANPASAVTTATMTVAGTYILRLTATDGALTSTDDVTITINAANKAPVVNAGPDQSATLAGITLPGSITDDGKPSGALTARWTQVSGPGIAQFDNPFGAVSRVSFSKQGNYTLRLTGSDSQLSASDDVLVAVRRK